MIAACLAVAQQRGVLLGDRNLNDCRFQVQHLSKRRARIQVLTCEILQVRSDDNPCNRRPQLRAIQARAGLGNFRTKVVGIGPVGAGLRAAVGQIVLHREQRRLDTWLRQRPGPCAIASR